MTPRPAPRLDPVAVAGYLWRGAPVASPGGLGGGDAPEAGPALEDLLATDERPGEEAFVPTAGRLPSLALLALRAERGRSATALVARWPGTEPDGMHDAARAARAAGARVEVVDFAGCDAPQALAEWLAASDLPSVDAFGLHLLDGAAARLGAKVVVRSTGGAARFLAGEAFVGLGAGRRALQGRSPRGPSGSDPFDVAARAADEERAYGRVPVPRLYARLALLPAATRAALMPTVARPTDGDDVARAGGLLEQVSRAAEAVARSHAAAEAVAPVAVERPYLRPDVAAAAARLSTAVRFGRPGSGGWLRRSLRARRGWTTARPAAGFGGALDLWLRGPLAPWVAERLAPERVRAQGLLEPSGVAALWQRFRTRQGGVGARSVLGLALLSHALDRDGLRSRPS